MRMTFESISPKYLEYRTIFPFNVQLDINVSTSMLPPLLDCTTNWLDSIRESSNRILASEILLSISKALNATPVIEDRVTARFLMRLEMEKAVAPDE